MELHLNNKNQREGTKKNYFDYNDYDFYFANKEDTNRNFLLCGLFYLRNSYRHMFYIASLFITFGLKKFVKK